MNLRVEKCNDNWLLLGGTLPAEIVQPGQVWQGAGGSTVEVLEVNGDWIKYSQQKGSDHEKNNFAFQCRYSLVVA